MAIQRARARQEQLSSVETYTHRQWKKLVFCRVKARMRDYVKAREEREQEIERQRDDAA